MTFRKLLKSRLQRRGTGNTWSLARAGVAAIDAPEERSFLVAIENFDFCAMLAEQSRAGVPAQCERRSSDAFITLCAEH